MKARKEAIRLLIVDDDDTFRKVLSNELSRRGYAVITAANGREAIERACRTQLDVILLDLRLPDLGGIEIIERLRAREVSAGIVVLTGHGTVDTAVQAIQLGASDYLEKPSPMDHVEMAIQKTYKQAQLVRRHRILEDGFTTPDVGVALIGVSPSFLQMRERVEKLAPLGSTVMVLGETGVGKEMVAKLLHSRSPRAKAPFVVVDCACLREELLQSELFGHEKGAFTGANRLKHGLFEVADTGSLFLDEVGDTSPEVQAKLLRVLETGRFRRVGGTREIQVNVRVISATNRNLEEAVRRGQFREDLFFRLSSLEVDVPPLRERVPDIRALVEHFASLFNQRMPSPRRLAPEVLDVLCQYHWPGNVRELIHVVEQTLALADGETVGLTDLPPRFHSSGPIQSVETEGPLTLSEVERRHVLLTLERQDGNRAQTAELLAISERNLYRLLKRYRNQASKDSAAEST